MHEVKTRFSELLERAHAGEEVSIAKAGKPPARLVPIASGGERHAGAFRGRIKRRKGRLHGVDEYLAGHAEWHRRWGFTMVAFEPDDAVAAGSLSIPHDDPFDRMTA